MDEHKPRCATARPIRCSASHWEAPREIHPGEWEDAPAPILVRDVRSFGRITLSTGICDAPHLLRSKLLRDSLQRRRPASRQSGHCIMSNPIFGAESAGWGKGHYDENS
jgi:hypothetical protein